MVLSVAGGVRGFRLGAPGGWAPPLSLALTLLIHPAHAEDASPELIQPPVCSAETAYQPALKGLCEVTPRTDGHAGNTVKVNLTANTSRIEVGGYSVVTEHYNGAYVPPVVRANPGDIVAAHLENLLASRGRSDGHCAMHGSEPQGGKCENPTNLHFFHGGIVSPNNARRPDDPSSIDASQGNGDNIYVHLPAGRDVDGTPNSFDFNVPIPGKGELDARVLEGKPGNYIEHPSGLNWYRSHLHGISAAQVTGGLSGLLSVGDDTANVKAACNKDRPEDKKCTNDVDAQTAELKKRTDVRYALLRDISLRNIGAQPEVANGSGADWAPEDQDSPHERSCGVLNPATSRLDENPKLRKGFCQHDNTSAWLFTLNGQRFPTITVEGGHNLLLRLGNLSANVAYWLDLKNEQDDNDVRKLTLLSLDGVVPANPVDPDQAAIPVEAKTYDYLFLMPASRSEIYLRNDCEHPDTQVYVLRTKGLTAGDKNARGIDWWPGIQLARIVFKPSTVRCTIGIAVNAPIQHEKFAALFPARRPREEVIRPDGCVRDLDPTKWEHRRVTFKDFGTTSDGRRTAWSVLTEIVHPPRENPKLADESEFQPSDTDNEKTTIGPVPFEDYVRSDGTIDWSKKHVCIFVDHTQEHKGSHKQLWVLNNETNALHNFHIHQMKFRLATAGELTDVYHVLPPVPSHDCDPNCQLAPDYEFYDTGPPPDPDDPQSQRVWHDTIPIPAGGLVFVIMSFDATQQIGRFVFHCHILKHEDNGLMAPIEVWEPSMTAAQ